MFSLAASRLNFLIKNKGVLAFSVGTLSAVYLWEQLPQPRFALMRCSAGSTLSEESVPVEESLKVEGQTLAEIPIVKEENEETHQESGDVPTDPEGEKAPDEQDLFMLEYLDIPAIEEKIRHHGEFTEEDLKNVPKNPHCEFCNSPCSTLYLGSIACHHVAVNAGMEEYGQPEHCFPYYIQFMKCYAPIVEAMKAEEEEREKTVSSDTLKEMTNESPPSEESPQHFDE